MSFAIHQHWKEAFVDFPHWFRVQDHFDLINGYPFKSENFNLEGIGKPLVRIRDLLSDTLPTFYDGDDGGDFIVKNGDIVIGMDGDFNSVTWSKGEALLNQRVCALRAKQNSGVDARILGYQIPISLKIINDLTPWSTVKHLSSLDVLSLRFPKFDPTTQGQIVEFLDRETASVDNLIQKKKRQVELLREKQKSFASEEVTGANNSEKSGTGLGQLPFAPSHWRVHRVATVFRESFEMGGEELPVLSVSINWGISDRELDDEDRHRIVTHIEDRNAYKRVRVGDLVYNMMRAWQGGFGVAKVDGLVSPAYVVARPSEEIHAPFFEHLLRTPMWIEEFRRSSKGIADFRQRLYWEHFRQVGLVLPPLEEQVEIANRIAANDAAIEAALTPIQVSIERLAEFRSAMITSAVTGQIDVETWGKEGNTDRRLDQIEEEMSVREARA